MLALPSPAAAVGTDLPGPVEVDQSARARAWISPSYPSSAQPSLAGSAGSAGSAGKVARRDLHGRREGGQGVAESAAGRLQRRLPRVEPVAVFGRRAAQLFGASADPAQPAPHSARRDAQLLADAAMTVPAQPLGQRGGDDLDSAPAAGDTPARQQHVSAPAVGAPGAPRRQPRPPPPVARRHHPRPGV